MTDTLQFTYRKSIQQQFHEFHEANPWVYQEMVKLARRAKARGAQKVGIGMLTEIVRWRRAIATQDWNSGFKINNSYRSRYARLIMQQEPDLDGVFDTRELKAL